jgi:general secretion pathway protein G
MNDLTFEHSHLRLTAADAPQNLRPLPRRLGGSMPVEKIKSSEKGFTLIELIVVLVILGLLAAVVAPKIIGKLSQSKAQIAKIQIKELESALALFSFDVGRFPTVTEGLEALRRNPGNLEAWKGPYLEKEVPLDPWGKPYVFRIPSNHGNDYDLFSYGPDGVEGGEGENADVGNWN